MRQAAAVRGVMSSVKAIRERLAMSQREFATAYRIPLTTLQGWEQADATSIPPIEWPMAETGR